MGSDGEREREREREERKRRKESRAEEKDDTFIQFPLTPMSREREKSAGSRVTASV